VSKHLATLTRYGFVERTAQGTSGIYKIADPRVYQLCDLVCGQMAQHFANQAQLLGAAPPAAFHYVDLGNMAVIGRASAVVEARRLKLSGFVAWLGWAFVHLLKLMGVENRIKVFVTWAWHYVTWNSDGRIITTAPAPPPAPREPAPKTA
jgi:hypothetical protein